MDNDIQDKQQREMAIAQNLCNALSARATTCQGNKVTRKFISSVDVSAYVTAYDYSDRVTVLMYHLTPEQAEEVLTWLQKIHPDG